MSDRPDMPDGPASDDDRPIPEKLDESSLFSEEALLDAFDSAWQADASPPLIQTYLDMGTEQGLDSSSLLLELVGIDLEYQLQSAGFKPWLVQDYLAKFPGLTLTSELVEDEIRLRRQRGETISEAMCREQFSEHVFASADEFKRFIAFLEAPAKPKVPENPAKPKAPEDPAKPKIPENPAKPRASDESPSDPPQADRQHDNPADLGSDADMLHTVVPELPSQAKPPRPVDSWMGLRPRFKREQLLGQGSFGTVWRAFDQQLQRYVAIKTLHGSLASNVSHREALVEEARTAAAIDHPNLLTIHDVVSEDGHVHLVMRWVDGLPMDQWWESCLESQGLSVSSAGVSHRSIHPSRSATSSGTDRLLASVLARVSRAVHHAHVAGLVHCDLKPQNILVDARDNPTVLDFGLAIRRASQEELSGRIFGTPAYMSPEQTWGEIHHLDGRSDIWSLGVILYRLATGQLPFDASTTERVMDAIQTRSVVPPAQLREDMPAELAEICMRCLSKRVEDRFATAAELADQLQRYADQGLIGSVMQSATRAGKLIGLPWTEPDLVGREDVIDECVATLTAGSHPLLTLSGVGGIGKTQTAAAIARRLSHTIDCDVIWVEMAGVNDANQFAGSVLAAMGIPQQPNEPSPVRLSQSLAVRGPIVLVLDNLEQVSSTAAEQIASWLSSNESLRVLTTSQVPLRIRGETVRVLTPLSTDESGDALSLFSARAATAKPGFELQPDTREDAAEICRLVDGNPLAIELAAARVSVLTVSNLRRRLEQSFAVLKSNRADRPDRHRSLHAVVTWSVDLLDEEHRRALLMLTVWPAPIPASTAESMLDQQGLDSIDVLDELTGRHLVRLKESSGEMALHTPNTVQRYADDAIDSQLRCVAADAFLRSQLDQECLVGTELATATNLWTAANWLLVASDSSADDREQVSQEVVAMCVAAILKADQLSGDQLDAAVRVERLERAIPLSSGLPNLRLRVRLADAKRLIGQTDSAQAICRDLLGELASTDSKSQSKTDSGPVVPGSPVGQQETLSIEVRRLLAWLQYRHGQSEEAIELLQAILQNPMHLADATTSLNVILDLVEIQRRMGHHEVAMDLLRQGEALLGDVESDRHPAQKLASRTPPTVPSTARGRIMIQQGKIALQQGRIAEARNLFDDAIRTFDGGHDQRDLQQALLGRAASAAESGDFESARRDYDRCERVSRRLGDLPTLAQVINNRALADDDAGDPQGCCDQLQQAMEIYRQLDDSVGTAICLAAQAAALLQLSRPEETIEILTQPEVTEPISPDSLHHALVLGDFGTAYRQLNRLEDAVPLLQQSLEHLDQLGIGPSAERLLYVVELTHVLEHLGDPSAPQTRVAASEVVEYWRGQPSCRQRVEMAISQFDS